MMKGTEITALAPGASFAGAVLIDAGPATAAEPPLCMNGSATMSALLTRP